MGKKVFSILFVDDEQKILDSFYRLFRNTNYDIITVSQGNKCIEILKDREIAVLITDYRMPEMSGLDILNEAKKITPDTVRIMLTGYSDFDVTIKAINEGRIFKYIPKPWKNNEFLAIIEEAITEYKRKTESRKLILSEKSLMDELTSITEQLRHANFEAIRALSITIEIKDTYTKGHCDRVMKNSLIVAEKVGLNKDRKEDLQYASLLHDIGKIAVPAYILNKKEKLNKNERQLIEKHPEYGAQVTTHISMLKNVSRIILEHHERIDGMGYPHGKKGDELLTESKILTITDSFDAMTSDRSYRTAMTTEKAVKILIQNKNKQFDAFLTDVFIEELANQSILLGQVSA